MFKGSVDSDMLQGKAFGRARLSVGLLVQYERVNEGQNMCPEYAEKNVLINTQMAFLSLN